MREILNDLERWRRQGKASAVARVVDLEGSGPREPGAAMVEEKTYFPMTFSTRGTEKDQLRQALKKVDESIEIAEPEVAAQIAAIARSGVPVIALGALPRRAPGLRDAEARDAVVRRMVAAMDEEVIRAPTRDALERVLAMLPSVLPQQWPPLLMAVMDITQVAPAPTSRPLVTAPAHTSMRPHSSSTWPTTRPPASSCPRPRPPPGTTGRTSNQRRRLGKPT